MKTVVGGLFAGVFGILVSTSAHAAALNCSGSYLGYDFTLAGQTQGAKVVGDCIVNIGQRGRVLKSAVLQPVSSSVQIGVGIQLSLASADGTGTLDTKFNGGSYNGRLVANTQYGTFRVPVTCRLAGAIRKHPRRIFDDSFETSTLPE